MSTDEWSEVRQCCQCGVPIFTDVDRPFACSAETFLCFACAGRRGGVYDESEDRWVRAPDVAGLPDERRPHA